MLLPKIGLNSPITLYEGKILDGRNRYRACEMANVMPRFESYKGSDPVEFVINQNNNRRHQTLNERAVAAAKLANLKVGRPEIAPIGAINAQPLITREEAAKKLGVGKGTVDRAKVVLEKGAPETIKAMEEGAITVNAAF